MKSRNSGMVTFAGTSLFALCMLLMLTCNKNPVEPDNPFMVTLSLENEGRTEATFSGAPIYAIITLKDSVIYDSLKWHCGVGGPIWPRDILSGQKIIHADVPLDWSRIPLNEDTARNEFYDSVFITTGGGLRLSNICRVYVNNINPVFDSLKVGQTKYSDLISKGSTVYNYSVSPNDSFFQMQMYTRDPDGIALNLRVDWSLPRHGNIVFSAFTPTTARYFPPSGNISFVDTVVITVTDGKGGQFTRTVIFNRTRSNIAPYIDSIRVDQKMFRGAASSFDYARPSIDTIIFAAYAHDPEGDRFSYSWKARYSPDRLLPVAGMDYYMSMYGCTTAVCSTALGDTIKLSQVFIDSMIVTVTDTLGLSSVKRVAIYHGVLNTPPILDSLVVGDTVFRSAATLYTYSRSLFDSIPLKNFAHDTDLYDSVSLAWTLKGSGSLSLNYGPNTIYRARRTVGTDTVTATIADLRLHSISKTVYITINNVPPVIDTFKVVALDSLGTSGIYRVGQDILLGSVRVKASIRLIVRAHDPNDVLTRTWVFKGMGTFTPGTSSSDTASYVAPAMVATVDTCIAKVTDSKGLFDADTFRIQVNP